MGPLDLLNIFGGVHDKSSEAMLFFSVYLATCSYWFSRTCMVRKFNHGFFNQGSHGSVFLHSGFKMLMKANIYSDIILGLRHKEKQDYKLCCCWKSGDGVDRNDEDTL